jgi:hypothetical protein
VKQSTIDLLFALSTGPSLQAPNKGQLSTLAHAVTTVCYRGLTRALQRVILHNYESGGAGEAPKPDLCGSLHPNICNVLVQVLIASQRDHELFLGIGAAIGDLMTVTNERAQTGKSCGFDTRDAFLSAGLLPVRTHLAHCL